MLMVQWGLKFMAQEITMYGLQVNFYWEVVADFQGLNVNKHIIKIGQSKKNTGSFKLILYISTDLKCLRS